MDMIKVLFDERSCKQSQQLIGVGLYIGFTVNDAREFLCSISEQLANI